VLITSLDSFTVGNREFSLALSEDDAGLRHEPADDAHRWHLRLCRSGDVQLNAAAESMPMRPAATAFVPAGMAVSWRIGLSWRRLCIRFETQPLRLLAEQSGIAINASAALREPAHDPVIEHYAALIQHESRAGPINEAFLDPIGKLLATHVLRAYLSQATAPAAPAGLSAAQRERLDVYIRATLPAPIVIENLAAACELSQYQLMRLMKRSLGISPQQYVQDRSMDLAKKLLRDSDASLADIAFELGFSSQSHFTSAFRALTGHTPKTYRERHDLL
jgi:AraC family transcriptional regulator